MNIEELLFKEPVDKGIKIFGVIEFAKWLIEDNKVLGDKKPIYETSEKVLELLHGIEHGHFN